MNVEQAARLQAWALSVPVRQPPAEAAQIANHLEYMLAALPTRASDEEDGKKRLAVYVKLLRSFGDDALAHMARRACEELDWFPSARWCVEAAHSHRGITADRATALALAQRYRQQCFTDWLAGLSRRELTQSEIDAAPERHRRIAEDQGLLRFDSAAGHHYPASRKGTPHG